MVSSPICTLHTAISHMYIVIVMVDFPLALCHGNSREAQASKCVNQTWKLQGAICERYKKPWNDYCLLCLPMLISLNSPDGPFNHILWQSLFGVPQGWPLKVLLMLEEEDLMEGWPEQGERKKLVNECNQREATCLGLPVMTKYVPMYVLPVLPVCVN